MNQPVVLSRLAAAAATALLLAQPALAATPGPLYTYAAYGYNDVPYWTETQFQAGAGSVVLPNGTFSASANLGGGGLMTATMAVTSFDFGPYGNESVYASASVQYDFAIQVGGGFLVGSLPDAVPFTISGYAQSSAYGSASAGATMQVVRSPADPGFVSPGALSNRSFGVSCSATFTSGCGLQALSVSGFITPYYDGYPGFGEIGRVKLSASVSVVAGCCVARVPSGGSAALDPVITIDPAFLAAHAGLTYTVLVNPAVSAVPEPGSWALFIAGVAAIGGTVRRRREQLPA